MTGPSLARVQDVFWKLITAPEGVKPGLAELVASGEVEPQTLPSWIAGDERLDAEGRLDIYANMYFYRLLDVLGEDFERTKKALGAVRFHNLVTDYLLAHPSPSYTLRDAGAALPAFLETHESSRELPFLPDLARLERARNEAIQMENAPVLSRADVAAVPPESWGDLRFSAAPWVALLTSAWDLDALWTALAEAHGDEPAGVVAEETAQHLLVYRLHNHDRHEVLEPEEHAALSAALSAKCFAEVCEVLADGNEEDLEAAAARAAQLLAGWLDRELLSTYLV